MTRRVHPPAAWRAVLVSPQASLEDAMRVINDGGLRIAMVVDPSDTLLGIVTDGDVRRAILSRHDLATPVERVMNRNPFVAVAKADRTTGDEYADHLPLVDEQGRLVGLETYFQIVWRGQRPNWVFLMAGGFGRRMGDLTRNTPKPMLQVGGKPILHRIMEHFGVSGFRRFYVSLHYLPEKITNYFGDGSKFGMEIRYVREDRPLGTAGALGFIKDVADHPMFMMNGDILTDVNVDALLDFHIGAASDLTLCSREYAYTMPFGVVDGDGHLVHGIVEKPTYKHSISAGIYVLSPDVVMRQKEGVQIDMPDLIRNEIARASRVVQFPIHESWVDIGRPEVLREVISDIEGPSRTP